ncbi:MAG: fumarylacetoacetate hydrolase family protein [Pseudomonadota bacterium]
MRYIQFEIDGQRHLGVIDGKHVVSLGSLTLEKLLADGVSLDVAPPLAGPRFALDEIGYLPPLSRPGKIICAGLNYADHTSESPYDQPDHPTFFLRVNTSLTSHLAPIVRPLSSDSLDYEGELAVVIKKRGKHIPLEQALDYVAGYSVFNDGSVREFQFHTPQWTIGKNFDDTGAFGPVFVTADELPAGAKGLLLETRLNGEVVQSANTSDMIFDVASQIAILSESMTLEGGDVIVAGTPAGVGWARKPRLIMRDGDRVEVTIEGIGTLINPIRDERIES